MELQLHTSTRLLAELSAYQFKERTTVANSVTNKNLVLEINIGRKKVHKDEFNHIN